MGYRAPTAQDFRDESLKLTCSYEAESRMVLPSGSLMKAKYMP